MSSVDGGVDVMSALRIDRCAGSLAKIGGSSGRVERVMPTIATNPYKWLWAAEISHGRQFVANS